MGEEMQMALVHHVYGLVEQGEFENRDLKQCEERLMQELIATYGDDREERSV